VRRTIRYTRPGLLRYIVTAHQRAGLIPALVPTTAAIYATVRLRLAKTFTRNGAHYLAGPRP